MADVFKTKCDYWGWRFKCPCCGGTDHEQHQKMRRKARHRLKNELNKELKEYESEDD